MKNGLSRRKFLKSGGVPAVAAAITVVTPASGQAAAQEAAPGVDRIRIVAKLGDTLIPSSPGDPGYATLETHGITGEVMKGLVSIPDDHLSLFNSEAAPFFGGKSFVELTEGERADYLNMIADGVKINKQTLEKIQGVYRLVRARVFVVFYRNYPEHAVPRDEKGFAILPPGDQHQISNPNTPGLVTGWDIAGWTGPMTWEEEEQRRAHFKTVRWKEN